MTPPSAGQFGQQPHTKLHFPFEPTKLFYIDGRPGWWFERVVVAENGLRGQYSRFKIQDALFIPREIIVQCMYMVKYMNRLEFSSNMDVCIFAKWIM